MATIFFFADVTLILLLSDLYSYKKEFSFFKKLSSKTLCC